MCFVEASVVRYRQAPKDLEFTNGRSILYVGSEELFENIWWSWIEVLVCISYRMLLITYNYLMVELGWFVVRTLKALSVLLFYIVFI